MITQLTRDSHDTLHSRTIEPEHIAEVEAHVSAFMTDLATTIDTNKAEGSLWIFGQQPTILDAYVSALSIRLLDNSRQELLPASVQAYARAVEQSDEWKSVTHGRPTVYQASMGPVAEMDPK